MQRLYIGFTEKQIEFIRLKARRKSISDAAFVRQCIEAELQENGPPYITGKSEMQDYFRECAAKRQAAKNAKRDDRREKKRVDMQRRRAIAH